MPPLDQIKITLTWKQIVRIIVVCATVVAGYYKLLNDIEVAQREPVPEVTRAEYDLKFEVVAEKLKHLEEDGARREKELDRLRDSVHP